MPKHCYILFFFFFFFFFFFSIEQMQFQLNHVNNKTKFMKTKRDFNQVTRLFCAFSNAVQVTLEEIVCHYYYLSFFLSAFFFLSFRLISIIIFCIFGFIIISLFLIHAAIYVKSTRNVKSTRKRSTNKPVAQRYMSNIVEFLMECFSLKLLAALLQTFVNFKNS